MPFVVRKPKGPGYTTGYSFLDNLLGLNQQEPDVLSLVNPMGVPLAGAIGAIYRRLPGKAAFLAPKGSAPATAYERMLPAVRNLESGEIAHAMRPGVGQHEAMGVGKQGMERGFLDPETMQYYSESVLEELARKKAGY